MSPNIITGTVAGGVIVGAAGAVGWGLFFLLEKLASTMDKNNFRIRVKAYCG